MRQHTESVAALIDHKNDGFVLRKRCTGCNVMMFESLTLTPFCLEKISLRKMVFKGFSSVFSGFWLESGKICKNNGHTFFIHFINTFQSLGRCLNMRPNSLVLKQLSRDPTNVNA